MIDAPKLPYAAALAERTRQLIELALAEDLGPGDVTAGHFVDAQARGVARVVAREPGVLAGLAAAQETFAQVDPDLEFAAAATDGDELEPGAVVIEVRGLARSLLAAERTALNFLQRLSGIATATRRCVVAVEGTGCAILDTRKTTPGWRLLEKSAVVAGGGKNHRLGLWDRVMVKDNHLLAGAGEPDALERAIAACQEVRPGLAVELEADTLEQVGRFLAIDGVDWILLDNMDDATMAAAVRLRDQMESDGRARVRLEGSGNMTFERLPAAAATGIDAISLGSLTHSARALDLGLDFV